jgi:selenide, water dikinase
MPAQTNTRHILLLGAGHSHAQVLQRLGMGRPSNVALTLVTDRALAPYSGMLPGCVAGDYTPAEIHIDTVRLARSAKAALILARATGINVQRRELLLADRPPLPFDILSINTGITPDLASLPGAFEHALAVKPIATLLANLDRREAELKARQRPVRCVIIGGGPAGFEMALALKDRWAASKFPVKNITLVTGRSLLGDLNPRVQKLGAKALAEADIKTISGRASRIEADAVHLSTGEKIVADLCLVATAARVPDWLQTTGLALAENGGIAVGPTLQSESDPLILAAGDCATLRHDPRPRAGVFAVRQGPVLAENLIRLAEGERLRTYQPQRDFLTLLRLNRSKNGKGRAIGSRGSILAAEGQWLWTLKNRIDRDFMDMFMPKPIGPDDAPEMLCRGCAAKVGPDTLAAALQCLPPMPAALKDRLLDAAPDDAALISLPDQTKLLASIDLLPAFASDPFLFSQIVAAHALNDIFAKGGAPHHALAMAVLPNVGSAQQRDTLVQLLAGLRAVLDAENVALAGGHSATGFELALGLSVTGLPGARHVPKGSAKPGDHLILTKPLGSGLILAAEMRMAARGEAFAATLAAMAQSNGAAAHVLARKGARAMTDVTGFGLAGHLSEMLKSGSKPLAAVVSADALPLLPDARRLAEAGYHSTALAANRGQIAILHKDGTPLPFWLESILFDPQTAGGLLAAVPPKSTETTLAALRKAGYAGAAIIGEVVAAAAPCLTIVD